jgi:adenylate cyclase class IV
MRHSSAPREVEIKLALPDSDTGRRLLRGAGFRVSKRRVFEANTLFDTADGHLRGTGRLLRVREAGRQGVLTYKGAGAEGKYKDREEMEVEVSDPKRLCEMLANLSFVPAFRYEKYRTEFRRGAEKGVATLDRDARRSVSGIGRRARLDRPQRAPPGIRGIGLQHGELLRFVCGLLSSARAAADQYDVLLITPSSSPHPAPSSGSR